MRQQHRSREGVVNGRVNERASQFTSFTVKHRYRERIKGRNTCYDNMSLHWKHVSVHLFLLDGTSIWPTIIILNKHLQHILHLGNILFQTKLINYNTFRTRLGKKEIVIRIVVLAICFANFSLFLSIAYAVLMSCLFC